MRTGLLTLSLHILVCVTDMDRSPTPSPSRLRTAPARAQLIRGGLLPLLYDAERRGFDPSQRADNKALRALAFEGLAMFIQKGLWLEQSANERGAVLEAVAALVEGYVSAHAHSLSLTGLEADVGVSDAQPMALDKGS